MTYRNIQGMRAIAALMVVACHLFWSLEPMRAHWAKPFFIAVGPAGVDIFFVISGFIIYHVMQRTFASMAASGRGRAVYAFAIKRFVRIYPLYWLAFAVACVVMAWAPPTALPRQRPLWQLLTLIDSIPNYRVNVAWTLTFEVYFYAVAALSLLLLGRRALLGLAGWFGILAAAMVWGFWFTWGEPFTYVLAPILLEFAMGVGVAMLVKRGLTAFHPGLVPGAVSWMAVGTWFLLPNPGSFPMHLVCWGLPAAILIYSMVVLELRQRWTMPRVLQYLGDASFSLYLWHMIVFEAVAGAFVKLGWVGPVSPTLLTAVMLVIGVGAGLLSYHWLEKPLLRRLGQSLVGQRVASNTLGPEPRAGNLAA